MITIESEADGVAWAMALVAGGLGLIPRNDLAIALDRLAREVKRQGRHIDYLEAHGREDNRLRGIAS